MQIVVAGSDTTANTMAWLPYYFASDMPLQTQLRKDVQYLLKQHNNDVNAILEEPIVVAIAREVLRHRTSGRFLIGYCMFVT